MNKNNKKINTLDSMVDISYQILSQNKDPMSINELIKQVFQIKQIDISDKKRFIRLYLDIVLSGRFVFYGNDLWCIKSENLNLWDQDYFINSEEKELEIKIDDIEKEIIDFDDLDSTKDKNNENDKDELDEEKDLDIIPDHLYNQEENIEEGSLDYVNENKKLEEEDEIDNYDDVDFYKS